MGLFSDDIKNLSEKDGEVQDDFKNLSWGCFLYIVLASVLTAILVILKLTGVCEATWIETTTLLWFPMAVFCLGFCVFSVSMVVTILLFLIVSAGCLLIDWVRGWFK